MKIIVPVVPIGKPRMTRSDKWKKRPCVVAYREFADNLRLHAGRARLFRFPDAGAAIRFDIPMPKSWSKKKRKEMNGAPHAGKPDLDNCIKAVWDALGKEDCTIWHLAGAEKRWAESGSITIEVKEAA